MTLQPACFIPKLSPPNPENKLIAVYIVVVDIVVVDIVVLLYS
jgi:hypothetical protein